MTVDKPEVTCQYEVTMIKFITRCIMIIRKLIHITIYLIIYHRKTVKKLESYGLRDIKIYHFRVWLWWQWRKAATESNTKRYYYKANFNNKTCFVKLAKNDYAIKNEIFMCKYLTRSGIGFVPEYLLSDEDYDKYTSLLVTGFISDMRLFTLPADEKTFESICGEFEQILYCFTQHNVFHGDISASNVLMDSENHITIIDFALGSAPGSEVYKLKNPRGINYRLSGNVCTYDNAYSFIKLLDDCGIGGAYKNKDCYKSIERLIGAHTRSVTVQSQYYHRRGEKN